MLKTEREKRICKRYSAYDDAGYVHCHECPLVVYSPETDCACKAVCSYNRHTREWEVDYKGDMHEVIVWTNN